MLLCQYYIFIVLCGISTSFELPGNPSTDIGIKPGASLSGKPGLGPYRNYVQLDPDLAETAKKTEAKRDNNAFKREMQVPINSYKPPSLTLSRDNGAVIRRTKRKAGKSQSSQAQQNTQKATKKEAKKPEVSNIPIILGSTITSLILVLACLCICLRCGGVDNEDEEAFENETKEMRSFQRRRGRY